MKNEILTKTGYILWSNQSLKKKCVCPGDNYLIQGQYQSDARKYKFADAINLSLNISKNWFLGRIWIFLPYHNFVENF